MIISDLNYLEVATEEVAGGSWYTPGFNFNKNLNTNVNTRVNFAANSNVTSTFNKSAYINVYSNVKGNSSSLAFANEAAGPNSNTQGEFSQLAVAGQGSSQDGIFVAAANYYY